MDCLHRWESPLGGITLASDGDALVGLWFDGQALFGDTLSPDRCEEKTPVLAEAEEWLSVYFGGRIPDFTPKLAPRGTPFRRAVWEILRTIPYGQTVTYGEIAARLAAEMGRPRMSAQAVGGAVAHNPISLIIPCHRVVGAGGKLTGYAGGVERKRWLMEWEVMRVKDK